VIPIVYNLNLQLKPEQIEAARQRWLANGPRAYCLKIQKRTDTDESADEFSIEVHGGRVTEAKRNGETLSERESTRYSVEGLLEYIEATCRQDAAEGTRNYAMADFDTRDGHPRRYVHRIAGTRKRIEWTIRLTPPEGTK
jgi:hypothetical protein